MCYECLCAVHVCVMSVCVLCVCICTHTCVCTVFKYNTDSTKCNKHYECIYFVFQHPFIHPVIEVDYIVDKSLVVIIAPLSARGSMKDLIHRVCS